MAIYEYRCMKCKKVVEMFVPITSTNASGRRAPLCCEEECGGIPMERIISSTSFQLKGSGWAKDGYK